MIDKSVQKFRNIDWKIQRSNLKTFNWDSESEASENSYNKDIDDESDIVKWSNKNAFEECTDEDNQRDKQIMERSLWNLNWMRSEDFSSNPSRSSP